MYQSSVVANEMYGGEAGTVSVLPGLLSEDASGFFDLHASWGKVYGNAETNVGRKSQRRLPTMRGKVYVNGEKT
jgi:hypothetical protein